MNWEAIGSIGEIVGAAAVVVSVLYLAFQIRQNTHSVRGSTIQAVTETIQRENRWSSDLGETFVKAIESPSEVTAVEAFKLGEWLSAAMSARQNEYFQYKKKLMDQEMWDASLGIIRSIMSVEFCRNWWHGYDKQVYSPEFVAVVDDVIDAKGEFSPG